MTDEPFYSPTWKPPGPRQPTPGEHLWTLVKDGSSRRAELRDNGPLGVEFQLFADGGFFYGRRFPTRAAAMRLANKERHEREQQGWIVTKVTNG